MSEGKVGNKSIMVMAVLGMALFAMAAYFPMKKQYDARKTDEWIRGHPVNAMILDAHPETYPLFVSLFLPAVSRNGAQGLKDAQIEMQIIANVNYRVDYIWDFEDKALRDFIEKEYLMLKDLVYVTKNNGFCETYLIDVTKFPLVRQHVGDKVFMDYINASERLFVSATTGKKFSVMPGTPDYEGHERLAQDSVSYRLDVDREKLGLSDRSRASSREQNQCKFFIASSYSMLQLDDFTMSMAWRSKMERLRPAILKARAQQQALAAP